MANDELTLRAKNVTRLFRTLADETRFRLLRLLAREELTVNELAAITQLAQPRISNHLKILREEELIQERREGSWRHYRVDPDQLNDLVQTVWPSLAAAWEDESAFAGDDKRLSEVLISREPDNRDKFFDDLAGRWDEIRQSLFGDALGREILRTFLPPDLTVADIGTGTGYVLMLFGDRAKKLIAIDNSEAMLAAAKQKAEANNWKNIEFRFADAEKALSPEEVDVVTIIQVLHHIDEPQDMIRNMVRGLKPGGRLIIGDFLEHQENWLREKLLHRWQGFSRRKLEQWFDDCGLIIESFDVIAGKVWISPEGHRLPVPDSFTVVARK